MKTTVKARKLSSPYSDFFPRFSTENIKRKFFVGKKQEMKNEEKEVNIDQEENDTNRKLSPRALTIVKEIDIKEREENEKQENAEIRKVLFKQGRYSPLLPRLSFDGKEEKHGHSDTGKSNNGRCEITEVFDCRRRRRRKNSIALKTELCNSTISPPLFTAATSYEEDFRSWCTCEPGEGKTKIDDIPIRRVGQIPSDIDGVWYRNGPGKFVVGNSKVNTLDGDGLVVSVNFKPRKHKRVGQFSVNVISRFVKTSGFLEDRKTQTLNDRGAFGTLADGGWQNNVGIPQFKNVANTNIVYWDGKILALWEGGLPHAVDPITLETVTNTGYTFDGALSTTDSFGSHPKISVTEKNGVRKKRLINIGTNLYKNYLLHPWQHRLLIWEFDEQSSLFSKHSIPLERWYALMHDFSVTESYIVVPQSPIQLWGTKLFFGGGVSKAMEPLDEMLYIYVIPRKAESKTVQVGSENISEDSRCCIFAVPRAFVFHCVNAYEDTDGNIIIDLVAYKEMPMLEKIMDPAYVFNHNQSDDGRFIDSSVSKLLRYVLPIRKRVAEHGWDGGRCLFRYDVKPECLFGKDHSLQSVEFPCINPRYEGKPYHYTYCIDTARRTKTSTEGCFSTLLKLDIKSGNFQSWRPIQFSEERVFLSDPVFIPKKRNSKSLEPVTHTEDDGYIVITAFHAGQYCRSTLSIVDAKTMTTTSVLNLGFSIPVGLHTLFVDRDELPKRKDHISKRSSSPKHEHI